MEDTEKFDFYYLIYHEVNRHKNSTTKLLFVFNALNPTARQKKVNDILLKSQVNEDLYNIMICFRKSKLVFLANIVKMYRQILRDPDQGKLLRILWKSEDKAPLETYEINISTNVTSC